jgi:hypothetical protein
MVQKVVLIQYYNVDFYLYVQKEKELVNINYFIQNNENMMMKDIFRWCKCQRITCTTRFKYRKDFPITVNLWNLCSYIRAKMANTYLLSK